MKPELTGVMLYFESRNLLSPAAYEAVVAIDIALSTPGIVGTRAPDLIIGLLIEMAYVAYGKNLDILNSKPIEGLYRQSHDRLSFVYFKIGHMFALRQLSLVQ
jgi:hypothetical protein